MQKKIFRRGRVVPDFPVDGHKLSAMIYNYNVNSNITGGHDYCLL